MAANCAGFQLIGCNISRIYARSQFPPCGSVTCAPLYHSPCPKRSAEPKIPKFALLSPATVAFTGHRFLFGSTISAPSGSSWPHSKPKTASNQRRLMSHFAAIVRRCLPERLRRVARISAMTLMAISVGESAPISNPIGA